MSDVAPRTLVLLRHAKSDWPPGVDDLDRPLSERGRRDAPVAGDWVREYVGLPDLVLVSPAQRTRETWGLVAPRLGAEATMRYEPAIYEASASSLLSLVRGAPDDVGTLMLVGHNPGTEDLAAALAGFGDDDGHERMRDKYPTCAIAVLRFLTPWADVAPQEGELVDFVVPRG